MRRDTYNTNRRKIKLGFVLKVLQVLAQGLKQNMYEYTKGHIKGHMYIQYTDAYLIISENKIIKGIGTTMSSDSAFNKTRLDKLRGVSRDTFI